MYLVEECHLCNEPIYEAKNFDLKEKRDCFPKCASSSLKVQNYCDIPKSNFDQKNKNSSSSPKVQNDCVIPEPNVDQMKKCVFSSKVEDDRDIPKPNFDQKKECEPSSSTCDDKNNVVNVKKSKKLK
jgi:hypothetical protein